MQNSGTILIVTNCCYAQAVFEMVEMLRDHPLLLYNYILHQPKLSYITSWHPARVQIKYFLWLTIDTEHCLYFSGDDADSLGIQPTYIAQSVKQGHGRRK